MDWISRALIIFLANSIVQVKFVAGVAFVCSLALRRGPAKYQYVLWVGSLLLSSLLPVRSLTPTISLAFSRGVHGSESTLDGVRQIARSRVVVADRPWLRLWRRHEKTLSFPPLLSRVLAGCYALFLAFRAIRLLLAWRSIHNLRCAAGISSTSGAMHSSLERYSSAFRLGRLPRLCAMEGVGPLTVGVRHPLVLMPSTFLGASEADLDSAICHEVAHVSRNDFLMNLICELVYFPVSFHPAAILMKARIDQTRELACDDLAAEMLSTRTVYAGSLVRLAQSLLAKPGRTSVPLTQTLFDTGNLERRVSYLLDNRSRYSIGRGRIRTVVMVSCLAGFTIGASAFSLQVSSSDKKPGEADEEQRTNAATKVLRPHVRISQITFAETVPTIEHAEIEAFAKQIRALDKLEQESGLEEVGERTRTLWQDHGYFRVIVNTESKVVSESPEEKVLSVSASVNPGPQYRLKELTFEGAKALTTVQLKATFPIQPNDIFDISGVRTGLETLKSTYAARGYLGFSSIPETELDDSDHTIKLNIKIAEGTPAR
jgi:beta-lactamase regulating signal transducer with metallopeptidase domain